MKFYKALSVYDGYGHYIGRLEAYNGDSENFGASFYPVEDVELVTNDLESILEELKNNPKLDPKEN